MPEFWENSIKFWISTIAGTLGLGALWRFPFAAYDTHASPSSFLVIFGAQIALLAIPQYFLELSLGQYFQQSVLYIYDQPSKKWKGVVYTMFFTNFVIAIFYMYLIAYSLIYVYYSFYPTSWGFSGEESLLLQESYKFWANRVLYKGTDSEILDGKWAISWPVLISISSCWGLLYLYLKQRIQLHERIQALATVLPFLLLFGLTTYSFFYNGFKPGLSYLLIPDFDQLTNPLVWVKATEQVLFQMSLGTGILMQNASYRSKKSSLNQPAIALPVVNAIAGLMAALPMFDFLGFFVKTYPGDYSFLKTQMDSYGLTFVVFTAIFRQMAYPRVWTGLFFGMMAFIGFTCQIKIVENCIHYYQALDFRLCGNKLTARQTTTAVCSLLFIIGLPICTSKGSEFFDVLDNYTFFMPLCVVNFINNFLFVRNQNFQVLLKNVSTKSSLPKKFLTVTLGLAIPVFMGVILFFGFFRLMLRTFNYYNRALASICWGFVFLTLVPILYFYLYYKSSPSKKNIYTNILEEDFLQQFDLANTSKHTFEIKNHNPMMFRSDSRLKDVIVELDELYDDHQDD